jgi:hypothetical protein
MARQDSPLGPVQAWRQRLPVASRFVGLQLVDWLVRDFTIFSVPGQNWMLIEIAIILIGFVQAWWLQR